MLAKEMRRQCPISRQTSQETLGPNPTGLRLAFARDTRRQLGSAGVPRESGRGGHTVHKLPASRGPLAATALARCQVKPSGRNVYA